jgi:hypothetical protein
MLGLPLLGRLTGVSGPAKVNGAEMLEPASARTF